MKRSMLAVTFAAGCTAALQLVPAQAQFAKVEDAIKYRQSAYTVMSNHMGRLSAMARGTRPFDAAAAQSSAHIIEAMSHLPWEAFPPGSATDKTRVKGDPWKDAAAFKKLQEGLMAETAKLPGAVATLDGLKQQVGATGKACKACHDDYRKD